MQTLNLNNSLLDFEYSQTFLAEGEKTIRYSELNFSECFVYRIKIRSSKAIFVYGCLNSIYLGESEKMLFLARLWQKELSAERKLP